MWRQQLAIGSVLHPSEHISGWLNSTTRDLNQTCAFVVYGGDGFVIKIYYMESI